jgi:hypothetical protein
MILKTVFILLLMLLIGLSSYFYLAPTVTALKERVDAQAYQQKNLLEGIDVKPVENTKY